jgi:myosin heavy subunit
MISKARLFILILIILLVASLSLTVGVSYLLKKERAINLSLQNNLEEIKTKQRITEAKLEESKKLISKLQVNLDEAKVQIGQLSTDLENEKVSKQEVLTQVEQLRSDLAQQQALRTDLETKLTQAQEDVKKMDTRIQQLQSQRTELEVKIKNLEAKMQPEAQDKGVELGKIVVGTETAATTDSQPLSKKKKGKDKPVKVKAEKKKPATKKSARPPKEEQTASGLTGKVLVVNKDYDFLVISLGSKDGVVSGDTFSVYHNNKYLGDVTVEKLHDSMAAVGFVSQDIKDKVSEGDKVVKKTE